jgi:hypothetical protein
MLGERALQRVIAAEALDGGYLRALGVGDGNETGANRLTVEQHCARAALAFATPFLGSGKLALHSQYIEETSHRWRVHFDGPPVYTETHAASAMRSGVAGIARMSSPRWRMAFTIAGAGPSIGISPTPFAPKGP